MKKPIMTKDVEDKVLDALSQYSNKDKWLAWGMNLLRKQGSCILLSGPPGTGKTTIAAWMAARISKGFKQLNVASIGGGEPGATERAVHKYFTDCKARNNATIFIDECDHLLLSRELISGDGLTWQLGTTEALMMEINQYSGLIIMATNHAQLIDPALADRFMAIVNVDRPDFDCRCRLWKQKWPDKFPLQPTEKDIHRLAKYDLSGRQIETVIVRTASNAIRKGVRPNLKQFCIFCVEEEAKHLPEK